MFCGYCGNTLTNDEAFCGKCGAMSAGAGAGNPVTNPLSQTVVPTVVEENPDKAFRRKFWRGPLIAIAGLVFVIAAAFSLWHFGWFLGDEVSASTDLEYVDSARIDLADRDERDRDLDLDDPPPRRIVDEQPPDDSDNLDNDTDDADDLEPDSSAEEDYEPPAPILLPPVSNPTTIMDGIDYALVFEVEFYRNNNLDVAEAFGDDAIGILAHFVNNGMSEGRIAHPNFNVHIYRDNYGDLQAAFGDDLRAYFMHFINSGHGEGRIASAPSQ